MANKYECQHGINDLDCIKDCEIHVCLYFCEDDVILICEFICGVASSPSFKLDPIFNPFKFKYFGINLAKDVSDLHK